MSPDPAAARDARISYRVCSACQASVEGNMTMSVSTQWRDSTAVVVPVGEIDMVSGPAVAYEIDAAVEATDVQLIVVDLAQVSFLDSSGIGVLLKGRRQADEHGKTYRVTGAGGFVLQILDMTGVWSHLSGQADSAP